MAIQKPFVLLLGLLVFIIVAHSSVSISAADQLKDIQFKRDPSLFATFEGITPCDPANPPAPQIPDDAECEMMIWQITLYHDPETGEPTTYTLGATYGMSQPNTTGIGPGKRTLDLTGTWTIVEGAADDPDAVVYQLGTSKGPIAFVKISDDLLHVLSSDHHLLSGNGGWSYTLNRTDISHETDPTVASTSPLAENISLPPLEDVNLEPVKLGSETLGVFEGRTPCADVAYHLMHFPHDDSCIKIKWRLTLHQDPKTGQPTTYEYRSVQTSTESIGENTGTWQAVRAPQVYPDAILYQLNVEESETSVFFLQADDNNLYLLDFDLSFLVGDAVWSYTLSNVYHGES